MSCFEVSYFLNSFWDGGGMSQLPRADIWHWGPRQGLRDIGCVSRSPSPDKVQPGGRAPVPVPTSVSPGRRAPPLELHHRAKPVLDRAQRGMFSAVHVRLRFLLTALSKWERCS